MSPAVPEHSSPLNTEEAVTLSLPWADGKENLGQDFSHEIHLGENTDPDAPFFSEEHDEEIHIGNPIDPDESFTTSGNQAPQIIHIGFPFDPDDEHAWESPASPSIHIGLPIGYELPDSIEEEHIHIGEAVHSSEID